VIPAVSSPYSLFSTSSIPPTTQENEKYKNQNKKYFQQKFHFLSLTWPIISTRFHLK
jgi:hypothetical protein